MNRLHLLGTWAITIALLGGCGPTPPEQQEATGTRSAEKKEEKKAPEQKPIQKEEWTEKRHAMVKHDIQPRSPEVADERVLEAMRTVPRHKFVPPKYRALAYSDRPLPIGHDQTISQPYIVALMTDRLQVEPEDRVLEVGTGSGYQAAVLSELCKEVYTIEIVEELAKQARKRLKRLGYENVHVRDGDGFYGWEEHQPYDTIIVTASPEEMPQRLLAQLKSGGRMVIPLETTGVMQHLVAITKTAEGETSREVICPVRFVPMTGRIEKVD